MTYDTWTTLRLMHYWHWQPNWGDREGVRLELQRRGISTDTQPVPVREVMERAVVQDKCPSCGGELDTGWECNDCGFDAKDLAK